MLALILLAGCSKEYPNQPVANKPPRTYLWLFPDSTIREGNSRQRIRWWGDDPDGVVKGYLFASGKIPTSGPATDTLSWHWVTANDTMLAFPLLVLQDTFQVLVRAVDNSFAGALAEHALIRLSPSPFADANANGTIDPGEELPTLNGAMDAKGASLAMPLLNQPPSIRFLKNPNTNSSLVLPETTFTAISISWVGSDPDGDATIARYEIALNSNTDSSRWVSLPKTDTLISLVVPRSRSDVAGAEVEADLYNMSYNATRQYRGRIGHLKLDDLNTFYVRARDIAGEVSPTIQIPSAGKTWFVKRPHGKVLIVSDYINSDSTEALAFYRNLVPQIDPAFTEYEVMNIGRGLRPEEKASFKIGALVPPFKEEAFLNTLHLFDAVLWYTDRYPSLAVAQYSLYHYVRDASHPGKVLFSTTFDYSLFRGDASFNVGTALKDFAPIDSVSSVDLSPSRLLPTMGDTRIPAGYSVYSDSSNLSDLYPTLRIGGPALTNFTIFMRPIYRRADSRYIYHIQGDTRTPARYVYTPTLNELKAISGNGSSAWACGLNGTILHTSDDGTSWGVQRSPTAANLNALQMLDASNGWAVGDEGAILATSDGGSTWVDRSVLALQNAQAVWFTSAENGIVAGTSGFLIRTTNGGTSWSSPSSRTSKGIRAIHFQDASNGIAVGDSGLTIRTSNGGASWSLTPPITGNDLRAVTFFNGSSALAVGARGAVLKTTDAGASWVSQPGLASDTLRSVKFIDASHGWITGSRGALFQTVDGGTTWTSRTTGVGHNLNSTAFSTASAGIAVGTTGIVIRTADGGLSWQTVPNGVLNVGVIDAPGPDGKESFAFIALPLHYLNGNPASLKEFLRHIMIQNFGL